MITFILLISACDPQSALHPHISDLKPPGRIQVSVSDFKPVFKVGDTLMINAAFNSKDLEHWNLYNKILEYHKMNIYLLDPNPKNNTYGRVPGYFDLSNSEDKANTVFTYFFITEGGHGNYDSEPFGFTFQKNGDDSFSIKLGFILKKAGEYILGGDNYRHLSSYTKYMAHNKALATDSISRRFAASVRVYAKPKKLTQHGVVPVIFTNNGKNYLPIKVLEK